MPILRPTEIEGKIHTVLVNGKPEEGIATERVKSVNVTYAGFEGDWHYGVTRKSCGRVRRQYREGTEIRNTRQISIISVEDMETVAEKMGIPKLEPEWLGANILLSGIPDFTLVPPSSRLIFSNGTSLVVDMENEPCRYPGAIIERHHPGFGKLFAKNALNLRGVTAWVEREGRIREGDIAKLHVPPQRIYHFKKAG